MTLAAQLILSESELTLPINIFVDNQAAIKTGDVLTTKPGHYLIDHFARLIRAICRKHDCIKKDIIVRWVAGHKDVKGNEEADEEAKKAAEGKRHTSTQK